MTAHLQYGPEQAFRIEHIMHYDNSQAHTCRPLLLGNIMISPMLITLAATAIHVGEDVMKDDSLVTKSQCTGRLAPEDTSAVSESGGEPFHILRRSLKT